jgi:hypothetical protein
MENEHSDHPHHLLHGGVRVVKKGTVLMGCELVDEARSRRDRFLGQVRHAVHGVGYFQAMPMDSERLGQPVLEDDPQPIALACLNCGAWAGTVESPAVDGFQGEIFRLTGWATSSKTLTPLSMAKAKLLMSGLITTPGDLGAMWTTGGFEILLPESGGPALRRANLVSPATPAIAANALCRKVRLELTVLLWTPRRSPVCRPNWAIGRLVSTKNRYNAARKKAKASECSTRAQRTTFDCKTAKKFHGLFNLFCELLNWFGGVKANSDL